MMSSPLDGGAGMVAMSGESVCLSSKGKEFHIVGPAKENERCPNVFVRSLVMHRILLSEEGHKFLFCAYTKSKSDK